MTNTNSYPIFLPTRTLYQLVPCTNSYHIPNAQEGLPRGGCMHSVIFIHCPKVMLLHCFNVIFTHCSNVRLPFCFNTMFLRCLNVILPHCFKAMFLCCLNVILSHCFNVIFLHCLNVRLPHCFLIKKSFFCFTNFTFQLSIASFLPGHPTCVHTNTF